MGDMTSYELLAIFPGTVAETEINLGRQDKGFD